MPDDFLLQKKIIFQDFILQSSSHTMYELSNEVRSSYFDWNSTFKSLEWVRLNQYQ